VVRGVGRVDAIRGERLHRGARKFLGISNRVASRAKEVDGALELCADEVGGVSKLPRGCSQDDLTSRFFVGITLATTMRIFFCDPRSPWQRGSNENTNGLLRQYFPKTKPIEHSQAELNKVARELNSRPRRTLGFRTPAAVLAEVLR